MEKHIFGDLSGPGLFKHIVLFNLESFRYQTSILQMRKLRSESNAFFSSAPLALIPFYPFS